MDPALPPPFHIIPGPGAGINRNVHDSNISCLPPKSTGNFSIDDELQGRVWYIIIGLMLYRQQLRYMKISIRINYLSEEKKGDFTL